MSDRLLGGPKFLSHLFIPSLSRTYGFDFFALRNPQTKPGTRSSVDESKVRLRFRAELEGECFPLVR